MEGWRRRFPVGWALALLWGVGCTGWSPEAAVVARGTEEAPLIRSGTLRQNEIWEGTVLVRGTVRVPVGRVLTVERGTRIQFVSQQETPGRLVVQGSLYVQGTPQEPVFFTGDPEQRKWHGVVLGPTASGRVYEARFHLGARLLIRSDAVTVAFCEFLQNPGTALTIEHASPSVEDSEFRLNVVGVRVAGQGAPQILNNTFLGNVYGIVCEDGAQPTIARNLIANQREHGVLVRGAASPEIRENNFVRNGGFAVLDGGRLADNFIQGNNGAPPNAVDRSLNPQSSQVFGVEEVLSARAVPVPESGARRVR